VINLSLGGAGTTQVLQDAVTFAVGKDVVVLAAAGNSGTTTKFYPAAYPDVVSVAATNPNDNLYGWSNRGRDWVQLAAPGCDIAPVRGGGYGTFCGTSAATPIASGIAALALALDPGLTPSEIHQAFRRAAVRGVSSVQYGRVHALRTLAALGLVAPLNTRRPRIVGTASSGATLEGRNGRWLGANSFTYRWQRCDADGGGCGAISGATGTAYQLTEADVGATIRLVITGTNPHGASSRRSAATAVVARRDGGTSAGTASVPTTGATGSTSGPPGGGPTSPSEPPPPTDPLPTEVEQTVAEVTEAVGDAAPKVTNEEVGSLGRCG
jgi:subtilisin family serine protease